MKIPAVTSAWFLPPRSWQGRKAGEPGLRDPKRAMELAKVELELREWKHAGSIDTPASAYAAAGLFDEAVQTQMKAFEFEMPEDQKEEFRDRLELFRKKQPFVQEKKNGGGA